MAGCNRSESGHGAGDSHAGEGAKDAGSKEAGQGAPGLVKLSDEEARTAGVVVETLQPQSVVDQVTLTATVRANQDRIAHVAPRVAARVVKVTANLGDRVKPGQTLALLDSLELGEAHSAYRQAQSQYALARADFERAERLKADDIIPEKDFLRARSDYEKARAGLQASGDRLRLLDAAHGENERGPASIFAVHAPFTGTVIEKHAILGELAQPDKQIFTVADLSTLWIEANLFEKDLARAKIGAPATVTVTAYPGETFRGKLTYISSTVDKETRTLSARVEVPNPEGRLKPEMFATAAIDTAATARLLTLPQEAVLLINGQPTAFVQEAGGFAPRVVDLGEKTGNRVVVRGGLKEGEQVVTAGAYALKARLLRSQIGDAH
jgi:cobalt-zinc-cadmium efflux system membrane fusion protein